jgi:autophagy-related protein 9
MSYILDINLKKISDTDDIKQKFTNSLVVSDLDGFLKDIYDYYYNRGYYNIFTQTILDNLSYLFSIHFTIFNIYVIDWPGVINLCKNENTCEILDYISLNFLKTNFCSFTILYGLLIFYYSLFLLKSLKFIYKMKKIKSVYDNKLLIKKKEMENKKFDDILCRLIELQKTENFCRVKEDLGKFDIIARILRKENYMIGLISNNVIDLHVNLPIIGKKNFMTNYIYNNITECIMNFAFKKGEVDINSQFFNPSMFKMILIVYMIFQIVCIPAVLILKIIFWVFKNADNIKSSRNITSRIWSSNLQNLFKNYNELTHHFEHRINNSYIHTEKFVNCFKERTISLIGKFLILICGSFLFLIFVISSIDNRLLTDLKFMGKNLVWITFVIGVVLSISNTGEKEKNFGKLEEDYIENINIKEDHYKNLLNQVINIPKDWRNAQNFSIVFKKITSNYEYSFISMLKELVSILFFPVIWLKIISQSKNIIKFFKLNSHKLEGVGTVCSYSLLSVSNYKCLREKDFSGNFGENTFVDKKFINSVLYYNVSSILYVIYV